MNQYYIDLPKSNYEQFFGTGAAKSFDDDQNEIFTITLQPFDGTPKEAAYSVTFKKLRAGTARAGSWNMNGQFGDKAYPLWQKGRGPTKSFSDMPKQEREKNYILILRDVDGQFHGRWVRDSDFDALPNTLQSLLKANNAGWKEL